MMMIVAVPFRCRSIIPARFLTILAHLTMLVLVTSGRKDNIDSCLPFDYTEEELKEKDWQLAVGSYASLTLTALELAGFMSGVSMFMPTATIISIGAHASGAVALGYFIFDEWDCDLFWWVFAWCSAVPAAIELINILENQPTYILLAITRVIFVRRPQPVSIKTWLSLCGVQLPERYRGTVVENWARYWKGLISDYADVVRDTVIAAKERPGKAGFYVTACTLAAMAVERNPPEIAYRARIVESRDEVGIVAAGIRNPAAQHYLNRIESLFNEGRIRHISLGILSIYWAADYSDELALPTARCEFLQPAIATWHHRIIDVSFWNRFWCLESELKDFDINPAEWDSVGEQ